MDYRSIAARGTLYLNAAADNWHSRKCALIRSWYKEHPKSARIVQLVDALEQRIARLRDIHYEATKRRELQEREAAEQKIILECASWECRYSLEGVVTVVRMADYEDGKYTCDKCGSPLELREAEDIDIMLLNMGITTSDSTPDTHS